MPKFDVLGLAKQDFEVPADIQALAAEFAEKKDDETKQKLYEFFAPYDQSLSDMFKRPFSWSNKLDEDGNLIIEEAPGDPKSVSEEHSALRAS